MKSYKPDSYNSVSPYFIVNEAQRLADLLKHIFNASVLRKFDNEDGTIMHVELKIDDSVIMMADASERYPAIKQVIHVYVPDVDDIFRKAISVGCKVIEKPTQKEGDPDKRGTFEDFAGNMWSIGTQQEERIVSQ